MAQPVKIEKADSERARAALLKVAADHNRKQQDTVASVQVLVNGNCQLWVQKVGKAQRLAPEDFSDIPF